MQQIILQERIVTNCCWSLPDYMIVKMDLPDVFAKTLGNYALQLLHDPGYARTWCSRVLQGQNQMNVVRHNDVLVQGSTGIMHRDGPNGLVNYNAGFAQDHGGLPRFVSLRDVA